MATPRSQILGKQSRWLLDLDVWGIVYRFSEIECEVTRDDGEVVLYAGGLTPPAISEGLDSLAIEVAAAGRVNWAKLRARGIPIEGSYATVRRWFSGQVLEAAEAVIEGEAREVEYGGAAEPLVFSIERYRPETQQTIPESGAIVTEQTWPVTSPMQLPESSEGFVLPIVIGCPGSGTKTATPAVLGEYLGAVLYWYDSKLLIADGAVAASTVRVENLSDGQSGTASVLTTTDLAGRTVSYVKFDDLEPTYKVRPWEDAEYAIGWQNTAGGVKYRASDAAGIRGLGVVLLWLLERQTRQRVDRGAQEAERAWLDQFKVDTYINQPVDPIVWIDEHLVEVFPIRKRFGPRGMYYEAIRYPLTGVEATAVLDADREQVTRVGGVVTQWPDGGVCNELTLEYAKTSSDGYINRKIATAEFEQDESIRMTVPSRFCAISQAMLRRDGDDGIRARTIQTDVIFDGTTATLAVQYLARRLALPVETVAYEGGPELERFKLWEPVLLTDSEMYWSERPAMIADRAIDGATVRLLLELEPDPVMAQRRTS